MGTAKTSSARPVRGLTLAPWIPGSAASATWTPAARRASRAISGSSTRSRWGVTERATGRLGTTSKGGLTQPVEEVDDAHGGEPGAHAERELLEHRQESHQPAGGVAACGAAA